MNKPILCFFIGYMPDMNNKENNYGSEISILNLSKLFCQKYRVIIFGINTAKEITVDDVEYLNTNKFENFQKNNIIDIIIVMRYIYEFIDFEMKARKVFLWVQDLTILSHYKSVGLSYEGKGLLKNLICKIDGIITLTNWHKEYFVNYYNINPDKVFIIGNAIDVNKFKIDVIKQKNKFIYTSHGGRGIDKLLEYFHDIRKKIPDAELHIYRDKSAFSEHTLNEMEKYDYFHYGDIIDNDKIIEEFQSSEVWFYPTAFQETYCISAVEAQMAKCVCITSDLAGLTDTVDDRGILIKDEVYSEKYKKNSIDSIIKVLNNEDVKKKYQDAGYKWAKEQTWKNRVKEWYILFTK